MVDHVVFGTTDYEASKHFFLHALKPIGMEIIAEGPLGVELSADGQSSLCIRRAKETPGHLHIAFVASSREQVDEFYRASLAVGAADNGAPGLRPEYSGAYYAAFVIGPDGHNIEVVYHDSDDAQPS